MACIHERNEQARLCRSVHGVEEAWIYTVPLASATASFSTGSSNESVPLAPAPRMRPSKPEQKRPDNDSSNAEL